MRILHIGKFFPPYAGGMETFLFDLVAEQRAGGDELAVLVHGTPEADDPPWLTRVPVRVQLLYAPLAPGFPGALRRLVHDFRPDVIHLHLPNPSAFAVLLVSEARRVPWVVHWHSDVVSAPGKVALGLAYRLYRPFEQRLLDEAARIIVTSPPYLAASQPLVRWRDKCAVVPLGLDAARYAANPPPTVAWSGSGFRLLAIGRLAHYKGFEALIEAVRRCEGVELCIAGDGEMRDRLTAMAAASDGRVRLLGMVSDTEKQSLLADCNALCLPSIERSEAFGMVLLEAMRYGKPCIASDLEGSGMAWVVREAGCGLLARAGDPVSLAGAISALRDDAPHAADLGHAGRSALGGAFSIQACARAIAQQYVQAGAVAEAPAPVGGTLVVIPAKNEAATIVGVVAGLLDAGMRDVLVVDDRSTDGTGALAARAGAKVLCPVLPLGAWGGIQTGIRHAIAHGYAAVITMDADGQHEVAAIPRLLVEREQADVVIGAHPARATRARRIAWEWFRRMTGLGIEDLTSGFRHYNARAMQLAVSDAATLLDFQDIGVLLLLRRKGMRIVEVPVSMSPRVAERSRVFNSWITVLRYMAATTLLCLSRGRR